MNWTPSAENRQALEQLGYGKPGVSLHLAIMREPHYTNLLNGVKKWETRMTKNRIAPWNRVKEEDIVLWKPTGGEGCTASRVGDVVSEELIPGQGELSRPLREIQKLMDAETSYAVNQRTHWPVGGVHCYVTFIAVGRPLDIGAFHVEKYDRRAWVVLEAR